MQAVISAPSRTLAQQRRLLENKEFGQLARELPLARAISGQHIDKTSMVRLALSYIKLHQALHCPPKCPFDYDSYWTSNHLELMDSFLMVIDERGDVLYVSETISIHLGLSQVEMTGNPIGDYVHPEDWNQLQMAFRATSVADWAEMCNLRIKSSLTKRVNKDTVRASPGYKVLKIDMIGSGSNRLLLCTPLPSLVLSTVFIQPYSFVLTTAVDLTVLYSDERAEEILRDPYSAESLKGKSLYSLVHISDTEIIRTLHYEVFKLGAYRTPYYRFIMHQGIHVFYVESTVFRYTSTSNKASIDTITIVSNIL